MTNPPTDETERVERVEKKSAVFRKELKLKDLVLTQITMIVGATWIGTAGTLGTSSVAYWLVATLLFFVPLTTTVVHLNRWHALEGGIYQWAKLGLGEFFGFFVAFNLWVYTIVILSTMGLEIGRYVSYGFGPSGAWMGTDRTFIGIASFVLIGAVATAAAFGLRYGKWIQNMSGVARLVEYGILLSLPVIWFALGKPLGAHASEVPHHDNERLFSLNILGNMGMGAFSGFEYVAIWAGESKNASRAITRSVWIASPFVLAMFILGTSSVLAFVPPGEIDLIAPLPQAVRAGTESLPALGFLVPVVAFTLAFATLGYGSASFSGVTRLPMVAGWDGLLPAWFTRLHPKHKTPINSILFIGAATIAFGLAGMTGVGEQEAFQLLGKAALILYALTYLVMFAIPIVGATRRRAGVWMKIAATSGFAMTLLFIALAIFPIVHVESDVAFTAKIVGVVVVANALGAAIFFAAKRRRGRGPLPG